MMDRVLCRVFFWMFPALARRRRMIAHLLRRRREARVALDDASTCLRRSTTRTIRKLCADRALLVEGDNVEDVVRT